MCPLKTVSNVVGRLRNEWRAAPSGEFLTPSQIKVANEDIYSKSWVQNDGNTCYVRAFIDESKSKVMAAPTLTVPLRKSYFSQLKDLSWPASELAFEVLTGVMLVQSKGTCSTQTFFRLDNGNIAYCAGLLRVTKSGTHLFGRNTPKAMLILLPGQPGVDDAISLASSYDVEAIRSYKDLAIITIDKALCEQTIPAEEAALYSGFDCITQLREWTWTAALRQLKNFCTTPVLHDDNFFKCYAPKKSARARMKKVYYSCPIKSVPKPRVEEDPKPQLSGTCVYLRTPVIWCLITGTKQRPLSAVYEPGPKRRRAKSPRASTDAAQEQPQVMLELLAKQEVVSQSLSAIIKTQAGAESKLSQNLKRQREKERETDKSALFDAQCELATAKAQLRAMQMQQEMNEKFQVALQTQELLKMQLKIAGEANRDMQIQHEIQIKQERTNAMQLAAAQAQKQSNHEMLHASLEREQRVREGNHHVSCNHHVMK